MSAAEKNSSGLWILNSWQDLLLFVATPAAMIPLIALARSQSGFHDIALVIAGFGVVGHHFPGLLRAYGDRQLFRRFRTRFILAPLLLGATSLLLARRDLQALSVILLVWGTWHFLMQAYGFARIYDAKVKSNDALTVWLDFGLCLTWFVAAELDSPGRLSELLVVFYSAGGPLLPPPAVAAARLLWAGLTAVVTVMFLGNYAWRAFRGRPANPVKILLLASCIAFWWYVMVTINDVILGLALFEIFHDIQYLAIVWVYNRRRVDQGIPVGAFTRFLFRPNAMLIGLYAGLVVAYGYFGYLGDQLGREQARTLYALLAVSSLLHFYYDGFIWKVRERPTREGLGLDGGRPEASTPAGAIPGWALHGLKWSAFLVPVVFLSLSQSRASSLLDRRQNVVAIVPRCAMSQNELGKLLLERKEYEAAVDHFQEAVALEPDDVFSQHNLGLALFNADRYEEAIPHYSKAIRLLSSSRRQQYEAAPDGAGQPRQRKQLQKELYVKLASTFVKLDRRNEAILAFESALALEPDAEVQSLLVLALVRQAWDLATDPDESLRRPADALNMVERATRLVGGGGPQLLDVAAAVYAANGQFKIAVELAKLADQRAAGLGEAFRSDVQQRLALYRRGQPFVRPQE